MDTKKLRQKILDLAIHGKLVPQDPNDEPASVLLERIHAEKERLIAEGKIKRPKKAKTTSSESHFQKFTPPFAIPESWEWVTLPDVCKIPITDGTHKTPVYSDKKNGVPFLSSKDVTTRQIDWDNIKYIDKRLHEELYARLAPMRYDILLAKNGTTGVAAMVDTDCVFDIYVTLALIRPMVPFIYPKYLLYVINSNLCKEQFNTHLTGIGLPNLHLTDIKKTTIPLPPLEEQIKIVKEIDDLLSIVNLLEQNKETLAYNIKLAKSKILDLAMQGKLVPQDLSDEPAADMLRRINPKAKIITDNQQYQQLPNNWVSVSIESINEYKPETINPQNKPTQTFELYSVPVFNTGSPEILSGNAIGSTKQLVKEGDVLLCKINPHINRVWEISQKSELAQIASSEWIVMRSAILNPSFLKYYFESPEFRKRLCSQVSGVGGSLTRAQPAVVKKYNISIPPYQEQCRIVEAINNYNKILEQITLSLS
ncbi:MAG: restriction endonuclease subunit S [Muribaculaceae bacterium]